MLNKVESMMNKSYDFRQVKPKLRSNAPILLDEELKDEDGDKAPQHS